MNQLIALLKHFRCFLIGFIDIYAIYWEYFEFRILKKVSSRIGMAATVRAQHLAVTGTFSGQFILSILVHFIVNCDP